MLSDAEPSPAEPRIFITLFGFESTLEEGSKRRANNAGGEEGPVPLAMVLVLVSEGSDTRTRLISASRPPMTPFSLDWSWGVDEPPAVPSFKWSCTLCKSPLTRRDFGAYK